MKCVFDTDVLVAAMRSATGASAELIRKLRSKELDVAVTVALALEYEAVCTRAEHLLAAQVTHQQAMIFVDAILALSEPVETHFFWRPQLRDPNDEIVLEAVINNYADALVTFNTKDFVPALRNFKFELLKPADALRRLK